MKLDEIELLSNEDLKIAVARLEGWYRKKFTNGLPGEQEAWFHPEAGYHCDTKTLPPFHRDLNLMNEAEKHIPDNDWDKYTVLLAAICDDGEPVSASARYRAIAFVKIMGDK